MAGVFWRISSTRALTPDRFIHDPKVHRLVEEGPASDTIAECARTHAVDMVIIGAHDYGPA